MLVFLLASCSALRSRNVVYLSDLPEEPLITETVIRDSDPVIKPEDLLSITVTSLNPESNILFNRGYIQPPGAMGGSNIRQGAGNEAEGYLVDDEGYVVLPVLGRVKVGGLTRNEAKVLIREQLDEYLQEPIVEVRYLNFRVFVLGEVGSPSVVTVPDDDVTVIEALAMVGDMTIYGKRENVLVIREEDGVRKMARLNLNSRKVFDSPFFYLHQNDVVYVEPDKAKVAGTGFIRRNWGFAVGLISTAFLLLRAF